VLLAGWVLLVGLSAPAFAGAPQPLCDLEIEINALRGGSGSVISGGTKDITSKARILKGSAAPETTVDGTTLTIEAFVGNTSVDFQTSPKSLTLVSGKGGQGDKLTMNVPACNTGDIIGFVSKFSGTASSNGATCEAKSGRLNKTCK
jgi:hypothetical protein